MVLAGCADRTPTAADANGPYALDSGDKLRILMFGQEALSNSYAVDGADKITMPLVGAVGARGMSTEALTQATAVRLRQGYVREPHVAVEVETYQPIHSSPVVSSPESVPCCDGHYPCYRPAVRVCRHPVAANLYGRLCRLLRCLWRKRIIDSNHWRHYFLLLGLAWGLMTASRSYLAFPLHPTRAPGGGALELRAASQCCPRFPPPALLRLDLI